MTRKIKISFLILIWGIVAVQLVINGKDQTLLRKNAWLTNEGKRVQEKTVTAFAVSSKEAVEKTIKGYGYFGCMELSEHLKREMVESLAEKLGIEDGYRITDKEGDRYRKMTLTKEGKYGDTALEIASVSESGETPEQYIFVEVRTTADEQMVKKLYSKIKKTYREIGVERANVNLEMVTKQQGNLEERSDLRQNVTASVFDKWRAKEVKTVDSDDFHTVYGYSKKEDAFTFVDGEKTNVQIVFSYAEDENVTYIKVGIPMVNSSY